MMQVRPVDVSPEVSLESRASRLPTTRTTARPPTMAKKATSQSGPRKKPASSTPSRKKASAKSRKGGSASGKSPATKKPQSKKPASSPPAKKKPAVKKAQPKKKSATKKPAPRKGSAKKPAAKKAEAPKKKPAAKKAAPARRPAARGKKGRKETGRDTALLVGHTHDDLYGMRLIEELEFRHGIDVATLDIGIRDGKAKARGVVSDKDEFEAVRETIRDGGGISELEYFVQIAPTRREEDRDRARLIQEIVDAEPDLQAENIQVASLNTKVVLRGTVSKPMAKVKAGLLALRQDDVHRLRNRIVVTSSE